jgi:hypothetical protein
MFPALAEHTISAGDAVLMAIPIESTGHQADLVIQTVDRILALMGTKGSPLGFIRVQLSQMDPCGSTVALLKAMRQAEWEQVITTLCDSLSSVCIPMYLASVIYSSLPEGKPRGRVRVYMPVQATGKRLEVPIPEIRMPRDLSLLRELKSHPRARLVDLQPKLKKHSSTISRQITQAKREGFVVEGDGEYVLTPLGTIALEALQPENTRRESGR